MVISRKVARILGLKPHFCQNYYCLQTKFAKVMFLHLSVSHSVHGELVRLSACLDTHPPGQTPPGSRHPPQEQTPPEQTPPRAVHAGRYGQQTGSTHPTGMHTCFCSIHLIRLRFLIKL